MEDTSLRVFVKDAHARSLARVAFLFFIVVVHLSGRDFRISSVDMKVIIEVAAKGRNPFELPAHTFLEILKFLPGGARHCQQDDIMVRQMHHSPVANDWRSSPLAGMHGWLPELIAR